MPDVYNGANAGLSSDDLTTTYGPPLKRRRDNAWRQFKVERSMYLYPSHAVHRKPANSYVGKPAALLMLTCADVEATYTLPGACGVIEDETVALLLPQRVPWTARQRPPQAPQLDRGIAW